MAREPVKARAVTPLPPSSDAADAAMGGIAAAKLITSHEHEAMVPIVVSL